MRIVFLLVVFGIFSVPSFAEAVFCPKKADHVLVEEGSPTVLVINNQKKSFPNFVEPDIGGDYDEDEPRLEWNKLNYDQRAIPVIVHCFFAKNSKADINIVLPYEIKRCVFTKDVGVMWCE